MVRGLKKKLLIGLLSAAVVGTSLAPNVPLVGSFAQEVKADETTSKVVVVQTPNPQGGAGVNNNVTITKPAHSTVSAVYKDADGKLEITVTADPGYRLVDNARTYPVSLNTDGTLSQTTFDSGASVALIKETLTVSKDADIADGLTYTLDKSELDINNTKAVLTIKAKDGRKFETAPKVTIGAEAKDTTKVDDSTYKYEYTHSVADPADKTTDLKITGGKYEVLSNIKVDDSKLSGATVSVSKTTGITKDDQVTVTVSPQAKCKFAADPTIIADGVDGILEFKPDGDKYVVTISAGKFTKDDVKLTIGGTATYTDSETQKTTNSKGTTSTINKGVQSTAKVSANADGVYEAVKAAGFISTELEDLATTIEEKVLSVTADIKPTTNENFDSIKTAIQDDDLKLGYSFIITINKTYGKEGDNNQPTTLTDLGNNLITYTITIPEDQRGKKTYKVYRIHNGVVDRLTTEPNANGEYIHVTSDSIQVHASKFSVFAIGYSDDAAVTPEEDPNKEDPTKEDDNKPGTITPSSGTGTTATTSTAKAATSTTKAAKATTSTKKSSKTSSPKTADYAVNSLLALLTGAAGLFGITLINKKRKEDEE